MNKTMYIEALQKELKSKNVSDITDIIEEYEQHFGFKLNEGCTEEEIAAKLEKPALVAEYYSNIENQHKTASKGKGVLITGLVFNDIMLSMVYLLMIISVVVLGVLSVAFLTIGFCLVTTINIAGLIPSMPFFGSFVFGLSFFSLSVISAIGTYYSFLYVKQWLLVYLRWQKNVLASGMLPSVSKHPQVTKKIAYKLKFVAMISLIAFLITIILFYAMMAIYTKNIEFWHGLKWFM